MDETGAYDTLRPRLQALKLDPQRIESVLAAGVPDVNYVSGWIEMKYIEDWPKRLYSPVTIRTLVERPQQVAFITRRWLAGGPAWVMLRVARQYLLFAGPDVRALRQGQSRSWVEENAVWKTDEMGHGDWSALAAWLTWNERELSNTECARFLRLRTNTAIETMALLTGMDEARVRFGETVDQAIALELIDFWRA